MVIQSKWLTNLIGVNGIAWFPFLAIVHDKSKETTVRHERIHLRQQYELLYVGFILLYLLFQLTHGYWKNPFEVEAFENQRDKDYLKKRKLFSWVKHIKK